VGGLTSMSRPQDRAQAAQFYAVVLAVAVWNPAAQQAAAARRTSLSENARAFALLNMAISNALVSVMETKYHYNFWRPETAIRFGDIDGNPKTNPDPSFAPFIVAPCFPSYPSAHASASYAALTVLERLFGSGHRSLTLSNPAAPGMVLHYVKFKDIADDIDDARVLWRHSFPFRPGSG